MDIDFAILADGAEVAGEKLFVLGGGWTLIWTREMPATHRGSVSVGIRVGWQETNQRHSLGIEIRDADGNLVQEIARGEFEAGRPPGIKPGSDQLVMLAANVDFKLETLGDFAVVIEVDGTEMKRLPYQVVRVNPAGQILPPGDQSAH